MSRRDAAGTRFPRPPALQLLIIGSPRTSNRTPLRRTGTAAHRDWDGSVQITNAILPSWLGEDDPETVRTRQQIYEWRLETSWKSRFAASCSTGR
jgi:hypothetical protein